MLVGEGVVFGEGDGEAREGRAAWRSGRRVPAALRIWSRERSSSLPSPMSRRRSALIPWGAWSSRVSARPALNSPEARARGGGVGDGVGGGEQDGERFGVFAGRDIDSEDGEHGRGKAGGILKAELGFHGVPIVSRGGSVVNVAGCGRWRHLASLSASRLRSVARLSHSCLPLARAISHLTRPLRK